MNRKWKLITVLLFPSIVLIWMVGWSLYWIGDAQGKRKKNIVWIVAEWVKKA